MIVKICAYAILAACLAHVLRELGFRGAAVFGILASVIIVCSAIPYIDKLGQIMQGIGGSSGVSEQIGSILKIIGIGYLGGVSSDVCRDMGEGAIARAAELVTGIEIVLIAAPYFVSIIELGVGLI